SDSSILAIGRFDGPLVLQRLRAGRVAAAGRWALGHLLLWRLLRTAMVPPSSAARLFTAVPFSGGRRPRLLVSRRLRVPLSCGLLHPTVVIPHELCDPHNAAKLRWVFAHELTHLERRDARSCLLFGLGQAVYFYCPWFW